MNNIKYCLVVQLLISYCLCEISNDQKEKFLNGFKEYYNSLPNQVYRSEEGSLLSTQQVDEATYQIVASIRVAEINNVEKTKLLKCTATIKDSDNDVTIINNNCEEAVEQKPCTDEQQETTLETQVEVSEPTVERKPVQLVNEVQADTAITSGEQFIAIPRDQPSAPCVGCASHVNPQAPGVSELANLGVRHFDLHEPSVKHSLDSVIDVERQVQVVNGVRYVLTLSINSNNCTEVESENCASTKTCRITILVKPWVKLSNGGNYRAILGNNCTEEWQYGDNGEVLPEPSADNNQIKGNTSVDPSDGTAFDGDIQVKHNTDVESQPNQERSLTDEDIKKIQEQIISNTQFQKVTESSKQSFTLSPDATDASKQHVFKVESGNHNENTIPVTESEKTEQASNINVDKKKAIDELLDFFDFSGFKPKSEAEEVVPRVRRSYDYDLQVLSLAKDYHGIKNSIENARFMYEMAQAMVDYLNEMDMEVKNRVVKNVMRADEETENLQRFVYIQARVTIPCDKVECEPRDVDTQICNGVIDCSNENSPHILNTFCYNDNKESEYREDIREISLDDPVLRKMAEEAVKKIESDSKSSYALKINKIASAITQTTSGTLTKFSVIVENIKCNKSVPLPLRINCTVLEQLGSKICDVIVHERHWLKEKKISYTCTERPSDMRISKSKKVSKNVTVDDPEIIEMLQEAIQYLESQSDKTNKQKIVNVKSISSQIIAGFLTKIEFVVGYTDCTDENYSRDQINKCELLKGEGLRSCRAQIWDRSWIMDGRQIEVSCDDASKANEIVNTRKERSIDSASNQEQRSLSKDNDIDYKKLANESLYKFMQSSASHQHYEVVKVNKAIVQDISRKLINIDFSISPTDCLIQNDGTLSSSECEIVNPKNILHCHSKILANNWIDKKQYFVKCNIKYQQKKNTNVKERNPSDTKYYQLAEESLAKYLHDTGNPHHIIVKVEKVTTQIVSGLLTRIDFIISPKNDNSNSKTVRCHSEILEKRWLEIKAFNVSCQMKTKESLVKINTDDPKYMQIAVEALQKYIKDKPESNLVRVTFVDKVEQTGDTIKIGFIASHAEEGDGDTFCYAEVSETRESKSEIEVKCHLIGKIYRKVEITEDDPNYYKYVQLADESLRNYLQKINSTLYTLVSIEGVTVQWDGGIKTLINFTIASIDSENSQLIQGKQCIAEILEQPGLHKNNIDVKCELEKDLYRIKRRASNSRVRRQLTLGGVKEQDPSNPKYKTLAEESLRKYVVDSGITQPLQVMRIEKVSTQVVSGSLTRIDFLVSGISDSETVKCHSKVWDRPWLNSKEINVSCQTDGHRGKRQVLVGGPKDQNPTEPRYKALAEESLRKYAIDSGITEPLEVARVEKVTTQVVSGTVIRIDFLVSGSLDSEIIKCHSEVWDRPWLKRKDISIIVSCENDGRRSKRQVDGGIVEQDPSEPHYKALAEESLRKHMIDLAIAQPLKVAHVVKVTSQVVAGYLTRIDFVVSGSPDSKTLKCHSEVWEQAWRNFKEIKVSCENDGHRDKRQIDGGIVHQDPTASQYKALAEESLRKYRIDFGISEPLEVARVERVTTAVVAGSLTRIDFLITGSLDSKIIKCHSEVWEQGWRNFKEIKVSCENDSYRGKRELVGGPKDQDPTEPRYKALAEESLRKYTIDSGIKEPLEVAHVEKVTTQVVSGTVIRIDFIVSGSPDSEIIKCHSEVWDRPWLKRKDVSITVSCENDGHRGKRQITGGLTDQDPTEPQYKALAEESLRKHMIDLAIAQPLKVAHVEKVTTQVVAGYLTRIDFVVSGSPDSKTMKCHSEVWEQAWRNFKEITVSCENDGHRGKRQITGGLTDQDPTEPKYKALAEESLRKHMIDFAIAQPLKVAHVEKVTTQVVAGSMTRIDFVVSGSPDSKTMKCHSEVWEQAWRNFKEITVSCENDGHRGKRQIPGGITEVDPTAPQYKALAEESLQKYMIDFAISQPLQVVHVEKVTMQVVAGYLTRIDFLVSGSLDSKIFKCHSKVWDRPSLKEKDINVTCLTINERVKRHLRLPGGASVDNLITSQYKVLAEKSIGGNRSTKGHQHVGILRGQDEEDQDPNKSEYKLLAEESLRKLYHKKSTVYHKVVEVHRVVTRVVSGFKYKIDFTAAPTACSVNVSSVRARNCKADDDALLYCHSDIWDQPWLKKKKIDVQCNGPTYDNDDFAEYESDNDLSLKPPDPQKNNLDKYIKLAEEASEKYLTTSNRKYVHKVTEILSSSEQIADGTLIKIDYSLSPTTCLRNETTNYTSCKLKQPLVVFNCHTNIRIRPWLHVEKEITVTCKKISKTNGKKRKRESGLRNIRQIGDDDDELDEDTTYYYADRAVQHINDKSSSNNLHKLISIHAVQNSVQMGTLTVKLYIEVAETYCLRHHKSKDLRNCEEMGGLNHRLCLARLWPSPDDELIVRHVSVICDDEEDFVSITGVNIPELIRLSVAVLESHGENKFKLVHQGEPQVIPSLDSRRPFKLHFIVAITNCSKDVDLAKNPFQCYVNPNVPARSCHSFIWLKAETKYISNVDAQCTPIPVSRFKRSVLDPENVTLDYREIQKMVTESLEQLEMQSLHRYKQRVLQINSHSTKITSGKVTTIDFDVGYTSCLKYEWVANITNCNFLDHLPRRRCVAQIWERLWISNGKNIDVNCVDDETPLESHIEFESAEMANELAKQALKHIEAKYPHPSKQKVVRIFSLEKQVVAGIHYKMKVEVGFTDCLALSDQKNCKLVTNHGMNKFCRVNVWIRPWTDHPPNFRVSCDFQEGTTRDLYHHVQAEHLFYNFLTTYSPSYVNNYSQMHKRFEIFKNNIKKIHELNVHEKGTAVYGVTRFTDLSYEEFSSTYLGLKTNLTNENQVPMKQADIPNIEVPSNFDWREYDAVTDVKDQGSCGSCWAFSVTGNIEGQWKMQSGQLVSLSEQELVDCDKLDNGCSGGLPDNAYRAIEEMGGLELESDYPYEGADDKCVFNKTLAKVKISSAVNITTNETGMAQWLVHNGPISIGINANAMQFYMGGISHPWKMLCNPTNLDHGVLIVGFGVKEYPLFHKKLPYWIIKNSWGKSWGEQGYYRVYRGDGTCGVNQMASSAVI